MNDQPVPPSFPPPQPRRRGLISPEAVRWISFLAVTLCLLISVTACILKIWKVAEGEVLWRTVATCVAIAGGIIAFNAINAMFGPR